MNAYTFWEQGRDLATGKIVSMIPIEPSSMVSFLGGMTLPSGALTLSAVAQFGIWMEMRKMTRLREAEFEERRHSWLIEITNQWIDEHSRSHGILRDVTAAVATECSKMWDKVCKNEKVDVPQALILRIRRLTEFLEWNYSVIALAHNQIVESSASDKNWVLNPDLTSEEISLQRLSEIAGEERGAWWKGLVKSVVGLPLFLIPGIGPFVGGGAVGYGIAEMADRAQFSAASFKILHDKLPLLQFGFAALLLDNASQQLNYLLSKESRNKNPPNYYGFP